LRWLGTFAILGAIWAFVPASLIRLLFEILDVEMSSRRQAALFGAIIGGTTGFVSVWWMPYWASLIPAVVGAAGAYLRAAAREPRRPSRPQKIRERQSMC
jgi:hypothetical protein